MDYTNHFTNQNNNVLKEFWNDARGFSVDSEYRAHIIRVQAQINQFSFLFGLMLAERVLQHSDDLSKTLHNPNLMVIKGEPIAQLPQSTLLLMDTDENYELVLGKTLEPS